ncbi:O-antigen biosynthesis glycosyltransferase WbnK [Chryseobacterium aquaeductus]|uniref:O-antigen biosynthesis glycosyltransferase WbnK n=1 Tax=Chryseobacterium aquaeductus TaxID=2675056 RepID=A0A9N8MG17_9FLAO|nr:alpha-1,2-fucosyltransferase [Chryseobacterium aquaeductus]CAA7330482.1 O-antigen biosynthesis glycosyltransferase WbnK [Chryseobacterium potabilaquae]CAD7803944.1 O-antigen biosynthesis glycosyltransferase WbnK [Chryseobacterium aquaeductus]
MVAVELIGGLGNQMFQYATARALALARDEDFVLDNHLFANYDLHDYALNHFNIKGSFFEKERAVFEPLSFSEKAKAVFLQKKIYNIFEEQGLTYDTKLIDLPYKNIFLKGYFQSEKYFIRFEDQLRKDFEIKSPLKKETIDLLKIIGSENSVSLHIRRGDYVNNAEANAVHGTCDLNYYHKAIAIIREKIENPVFFIFSDDINWAKENLKIDSTTYFVDFNNAATNYEDIKLMSTCKHNIIANSSFSWWGAWLNANKSKIVIAPSKWFNVEYHNSKDIIPEPWMKI